MRFAWWLLVACCATACSTKCADSPDVLLAFDGDEALLAATRTVNLTITTTGDPQMVPFQTTGLEPGSTILLKASVPPAAASYALTVKAKLRDGAGQLLGSGTFSGMEGSHACNRASITIVSSMSSGSDLGDDTDASVDAAPDLASCVGNGADEDGDGLDDNCDPCANLFDPHDVDTDGDHVPDVCDPDVNVPDNAIVLFQSFNAAPTSWTGTTTVVNGALRVSDGGGNATVGYSTVSLGASVQVDTFFSPVNVMAGSSAGVFVMEEAQSAQTILCFLSKKSGTEAALQILQGDAFAGGGQRTTVTAPVADFLNGVPGHLRLSIHKQVATCELLGGPQVDASVTTAMAVASTTFTTTALYPGVAVFSGAVDFASLFAVTYP